MEKNYMAVTEAGNLVEQNLGKKPETVKADLKHYLKAVEIGATKPGGQGDIIMVLVSADDHRHAYVLARDVLPDLVNVIQNYYESTQDSTG